MQILQTFFCLKKYDMEKLRIAIQKSGRLSEKSLNLLKEAGISLNNGSRKLRSVAQSFPLEVIYLRDDDIPQYVEDGVAHIGIVGENEYAEKECDVDLVERLGYSRCRLSIAIPKSESYERPGRSEGQTDCHFLPGDPGKISWVSMVSMPMFMC